MTGRGRFVVFLFFFLAACRPAGIWPALQRGDMSAVQKGTYAGYPQYLAQPGVYAGLVARFRAPIEKNAALLPRIAGLYFEIPESIVFRYKFVSVDTVNNNLLLRYFGAVYGDRSYAGYQIQFVFSIGEKKLTGVYTSEVPLE